MPIQDFPGTVGSGITVKKVILANIAVSTTKTITVAPSGIAGGYVECNFSFYGAAASGKAGLKFILTGFPGSDGNTNLYEIYRANSGVVVLGATANAGNITFTVQNTSATQVVYVGCSYLGITTASISMS